MYHFCTPASSALGSVGACRCWEGFLPTRGIFCKIRLHRQNLFVLHYQSLRQAAKVQGGKRKSKNWRVRVSVFLKAIKIRLTAEAWPRRNLWAVDTSLLHFHSLVSLGIAVSSTIALPSVCDGAGCAQLPSSPSTASTFPLTKLSLKKWGSYKISSCGTIWKLREVTINNNIETKQLLTWGRQKYLLSVVVYLVLSGFLFVGNL